MLLRRALLMVVKAIEKRYGIGKNSNPQDG